MRKPFILAFLGTAALSGLAIAEVHSYYYHSLEWVVDASDSIIVATVVPGPYTGNPSQSKIRVKTVARVLKQVGTTGPTVGTELRCNMAAGKGHRVLLFTRPDVSSGGRITYIVFLTADSRPAAQQGDPFRLLPRHSAARDPLEFIHNTCVAIDRNGRVLTDPAKVVQLVEARVKADPNRVCVDGRDVPCGPKVDDGHDHHLLTPGEPKAK